MALGIDFLEVADDNRPVIVGERTNVLGSRRFKRLVKERRFEEAAEVGRRQVKGGAHLIDVCLQDPDADEVADMDAFLAEAVKIVKVPFVVDSTDANVMERALRWCQGKSLLNSVNLEDGLARFEAVVPLARRYGAALVVGLIDEDPAEGMAVTVERKLEVARRSHRILVEDFGVREEDIVWDPLVFLCGTGDEKYVGSARHTIEGVRALKKAFPRTKTLLGSRTCLRSARGGTGGPEQRLPLPRDAGRTRHGDREQRAPEALPLDPGGGAPALRGPDRLAGRRPDRRVHHALP